MDDRIKEQLRFDIELLKLIVILFISDSGGVIALILKDHHAAKDAIMIASGILISIFCIRWIYLQYKSIRQIIENGL